jgi:hypothetical protein
MHNEFTAIIEQDDSWLCVKARGGVPLVIDEPTDWERGDSTPPHRNPRQAGTQDLPGIVDSRGWSGCGGLSRQ